MRGGGDCVESLRVGLTVEPQLQHAHGFATAGDRRIDPGGTFVGADSEPLLDERPPVWGAHHGNDLATFAPERSSAALDVAQPDERLSAEVGYEEADIARADGIGER